MFNIFLFEFNNREIFRVNLKHLWHLGEKYQNVAKKLLLFQRRPLWSEESTIFRYITGFWRTSELFNPWWSMPVRHRIWIYDGLQSLNHLHPKILFFCIFAITIIYMIIQIITNIKHVKNFQNVTFSTKKKHWSSFFTFPKNKTYINIWFNKKSSHWKFDYLQQEIYHIIPNSLATNTFHSFKSYLWLSFT